MNCVYRQPDRDKAIKLLLKIFENIIKNSTQLNKYGHLNFKKISQKLSKCEPALDLLILSGFQKKGKRLIWTNTDGNIMLLSYIQNDLRSMINDTANIPQILLQVCYYQFLQVDTNTNQITH